MTYWQRFKRWLGKAWCRLTHRFSEDDVRVIWHQRLGLVVACRRCGRLHV